MQNGHTNKEIACFEKLYQGFLSNPCYCNIGSSKFNFVKEKKTRIFAENVVYVHKLLCKLISFVFICRFLANKPSTAAFSKYKDI